MTSTWKLLNMAIGTKSKTTNINSFTIDGKEIRDPKEIADKLNQYFCNTAKRVQEEALNGNTETPDVDFQSYLTKSPNTQNIQVQTSYTQRHSSVNCQIKKESIE